MDFCSYAELGSYHRPRIRGTPSGRTGHASIVKDFQTISLEGEFEAVEFGGGFFGGFEVFLGRGEGFGAHG